MHLLLDKQRLNYLEYFQRNRNGGLITTTPHSFVHLGEFTWKRHESHVYFGYMEKQLHVDKHCKETNDVMIKERRQDGKGDKGVKSCRKYLVHVKCLSQSMFTRQLSRERNGLHSQRCQHKSPQSEPKSILWIMD